MKLLVVGDRKTPDSAWPESVQYFPLLVQHLQGLRIVGKLPENHYARKNVGYLIAIAQGAEAIFDTDDDNSPLPHWSRRSETVSARLCEHPGWINAYRHFSDERIWPRGFPLEELDWTRSVPLSDRTTAVAAPIHQGVVDGSPDVDAIWRLTIGGEIAFDRNSDVFLGEGAWCPFNSQATWWFPDAYPLMYLPSHVSFRMTDIWRSFIAQRCLWAMGAGVVFFGPDMYQDRNPHDLLGDFELEVPGYLNNRKICEVLESVRLEIAPGSLLDNLHRCYESLIVAGLIPSDEMPLVELWIQDVGTVSSHN